MMMVLMAIDDEKYGSWLMSELHNIGMDFC